VIVRRIFYYWQFIAVGALPVWLLVGSSIYGAGGWAVLGVTFGAIALGVALLAVALLVYARTEVRQTKTVSWTDVGVFGLWHALVIGVVFVAAQAPGVWLLALLAGIAAFWFAVWGLFASARRRVREFVDAASAPLAAAAPNRDTRNPGPTRPVDPNVIVIPEKPTNA